MRTAYVLGAGGHARSVVDILQQDLTYKDIFLFDDTFNGIKENISGAILIGKTDDIFKYTTKEDIFIAVGSVKERHALIGRLRLQTLNMPNLFHRSCQISPSATIGKGNYFGALTNIGANANIGNFNIVNTHANIEHEVKIGSGNNISPNAVICGRSIISDNVFIGASSVINEKLVISDNVTLGSNSTVIKSIHESNATYIGSPARRIS